MQEAFRWFAQNERSAWATLKGCERPPADPYTEAFFEDLFRRLPTGVPQSWEDVYHSWVRASIPERPSQTSASCKSSLILVSVFKGRVAAAMCEDARFRRLQLGALGHYRVFKYLLAAAMAGATTARPPDSLFILDLSDRADTVVSGAVKLASSTGACTNASLPVPISLKGFGYNLLASRWHTGHGRRMRWPHIPWPSKKRRAVWRGSARGYSECLQPGSGSVSNAPHKCGCYAAHRNTSSYAAMLMSEMMRGGCTHVRPCSHAPHPRNIAVQMTAKHPELLDAAFTLCNSKTARHCLPTLLDVRERANAMNVPFDELVNFSTVVELDGYGWQAGLLSKLTLGSVVVTHQTLYPLWYDPLLLRGRHLIRTRADLSDLPNLLNELNRDAETARRIAEAGRERACAIMHFPHLVTYVAKLLRQYSQQLFVGAHSARLHHMVRRLVSGQLESTAGVRVLQPENIWANLGTTARCQDVWWRDPRCA